jgi:hypothetical protein
MVNAKIGTQSVTTPLTNHAVKSPAHLTWATGAEVSSLWRTLHGLLPSEVVTLVDGNGKSSLSNNFSQQDHLGHLLIQLDYVSAFFLCRRTCSHLSPFTWRGFPERNRPRALGVPI